MARSLTSTWERTFAVITVRANELIAPIHDRMPVILPRERYAQWIDPASRYRDLIEPEADTLELVRVSSVVNSVKNDGPECAERVAGGT